MDWRLERLLFPPMMGPRYPALITKELFSVEPLVPEGCMEVWSGSRKRMGGVLRRRKEKFLAGGVVGKRGWA